MSKFKKPLALIFATLFMVAQALPAIALSEDFTTLPAPPVVVYDANERQAVITNWTLPDEPHYSWQQAQHTTAELETAYTAAAAATATQDPAVTGRYTIALPGALESANTTHLHLWDGYSADTTPLTTAERAALVHVTPLSVAVPMPLDVTINVVPGNFGSSNRVTFTNNNTAWPKIYYAFDNSAGIPTAGTIAALHAEATEYTTTINGPAQDGHYIVWYSKNAADAGKGVIIPYFVDQTPPNQQITPYITKEGSNLVLKVTRQSSSLYPVYYDTGSPTSTPYTDAGITLSNNMNFTFNFYYSRDGGTTKVMPTSLPLNIEDGQFNIAGADESADISILGDLMTIRGQDTNTTYTVDVRNATTDEQVSLVSKRGPFTEIVSLPSSYKYSVETRKGTALTSIQNFLTGTVAAITGPLPQPANVTYDPVTGIITSTLTLPADTVEYKIFKETDLVNPVLTVTGETPVTGLASGKYKIKATAKSSINPNLTSETVTASTTIMIDKDKPTVGLIVASTTGSIPGVIVQASDTGSGIDRIEAKINNIPVTDPAVITPGQTLYAQYEGVNTFTVTVYDKHGNFQTVTQTVNYSTSILNPVINIIPAATTIQPTTTTTNTGTTTAQPITGISAAPQNTADKEWYNTLVDVSVTATNTSKFLSMLVLSNSGATAQMAQAPDTITPTLSLTSKLLTDGVYNLSAQAYSPGGLPSGNTVTRIVKIDTTKPAQPVVTISDKGVLTISATDTGSGIKSINYTVNGGQPTLYGGEVTLEGNEATTVVATAYDNAGNVSATTSVTKEIHTVKPEAPTFSGLSTGWAKEVDFVEFTIASAAETTTHYSVGDKTATYKDGEAITVDEEGATRVSAYSVDKWGNKSDVTTGYVYLDNTAPEMRVVLNSVFNGESTAAAFRVYFYDLQSGIKSLKTVANGLEKDVQISAKDRSKGYKDIVVAIPSQTDVVSTEQAEATLAPVGTHNIEFKAMDKAGNESSVVFSSSVQLKANPVTGNK